jgi:hypothetical protein
MLILRCDDVQNMAVDGDSESFEVCEGLLHSRRRRPRQHRRLRDAKVQLDRGE